MDFVTQGDSTGKEICSFLQGFGITHNYIKTVLHYMQNSWQQSTK